MSAPPYMKLYVADYHGDTTHLDVKEHGAYLLLLMAMWRAGGKLPADDPKLAKLAKCTSEEWAEIRVTVLAFFRRTGGRLTHKRVSAEIAKYADTSAKRKAASEKGVSEKRRKNSASHEPNGQPNTDHLVTKPEPEPEPITPVAPKGAPSRSVTKDDVEAVWSITPKASRQRSGKADVERTLKAALQRGHQPEWVLVGLKAYFASDAATKDGGAFVKGVHRMIEADRWETFAPAAASAPDLFAAAAPAEADYNPWPSRVREFICNAYWNSLDWGPRPGREGCTVSAEDLAVAGFTPNLVTLKRGAA